MDEEKVRGSVKESYSQIAKSGCGCNISCCGSEDVSKHIGYSDEELGKAPDANLGLGCGNPTALGKLEEGMVVLDLGSGAGFDAFLAADKVKDSGKVIGIDMTKEMVEKARENAKKYNYNNVEFRLAEIEKLPLEENSVDVIISNCVINLSPEKQDVFKEAYRVLKKGGRLYVSDIVLLEELSEEQRNDENLIASCVGGAILRDEYLQLMQDAGFNVKILEEDKEISDKQYQGINLESLKVEASKSKL